MKKFKNKSTESQYISGMPMFKAGESRMVDTKTAAMLSRNDNFEEVKKIKEAKKDKKVDYKTK